MINKKRLVDTFVEMVKIYSPSKKEKEIANYLIERLEKLGADEIHLDENYDIYGGNAPVIFAKFKGQLRGDGVTLCAHMDVIEPCSNINVICEEDIIKTDGKTTLGGDDKGGVAAILEVLETIKEKNLQHRDICVVFTPCEEAGLAGAKSIKWNNIPEKVFPAKNMIVVDNAGKSGIIAHTAPSKYDFRFEIYGKKAHAGIEPEKGINSIVVASEIISKFTTGRIDTTTTSNISKIESNFATNVVPDFCSFEGEIRGHSEEKIIEILSQYESICNEVCNRYGAQCKFEKKCDFPILKPKDDLKFAKAFEKVYLDMGIDTALVVIGGGSDSNIFAKQGFNSIIIGIGMYKVHTTEEYLELADLYNTTEAILRYVTI